MRASLDALDSLDRYTVASQRAAKEIIEAYSTSFGAATRLLGPRHRSHVRNIYALVRVADELVDGASAEAGVAIERQHEALNELEHETERALDSGYSSNPIVHAFAYSARLSRIDRELTSPFFASMRTDLAVAPTEGGAGSALLRFDDDAHASYVYGSAEVIGLMCLRVFIRDESRSDEQLRTLEHGARSLGAAFQNVNFLRDLADDTERLGRSYLGSQQRIDAVQQERWIATIRAQLTEASATLPLLPADARAAVRCALRLFESLTRRLERTPAPQLYVRRVRVPAREKAWLLAQAAVEYRKGRIA